MKQLALFSLALLVSGCCSAAPETPRHRPVPPDAGPDPGVDDDAGLGSGEPEISFELAAPLRSDAWRWVQPTPSAHALRAVWAWDAGRAIAVGDVGTILRTEDSGKSWSSVSVTSTNLRALWGTDDGVLFAVGDSGLVLRSSEHGQTFEASHAGHGTLRSVRGDGEDVVIAVGQEGLFRSEDGGATFVDRGEVPLSLLRVWRDDAGVFWVVGLIEVYPGEPEEPVFVTSSDNGVTWKHVPYTKGLADIVGARGWLYGVAGMGAVHHRSPDGRWGVGPYSHNFANRLRITDGDLLWTLGHAMGFSSNHGESFTFLGPAPDFEIFDLTEAADGGLYVVGEGSGIARSEDGGQTWTRLVGGPGSDLFSLAIGPDDRITAAGRSVVRVDVDGSDPQHSPRMTAGLSSVAVSGDRIWVGGYGTLLRSDDGGATWVELPGLPSIFPADVFALDNGEMVALTEDGIITTDNKGATFSYRVHAGEERLGGLWAQTSDTLWAVGGGGLVLRSADRGRSWKEIEFPHRLALVDVWGRGEKLLLVVDATGEIFRSTDGGETWKPGFVDDRSHASMSGIELWGADKGPLFAVTGEGLYRSQDGLRWRPVKQDLGAIDSISGDGRRVWVVSDKGLFQSTNRGARFEKLRVGVRGAEKIAAVGGRGKELIAVGEHGAMLRSTDGGRSWKSRMVTGLSNVISTFKSVVHDGDRLWIAGCMGAVLSSDDGGVSWQFHNVPANMKQYGSCKLLRLSDGTLLFNGGKGIVARSTDRGGRFTAVDTGAGESLHALIEDGDRVFGVGGKGVFVVSADRGKTWRAGDVGEETWLFGLAARGTDLVAVGHEGAIVRSADGGESWQAVESPTDEALRAVARFGTSGVIAVGASGTVVVSRDGGRSFSLEETVTRYDLNAVVVDEEGRVFVAGQGGAILEWGGQSGRAGRGSRYSVIAPTLSE